MKLKAALFLSLFILKTSSLPAQELILNGGFEDVAVPGYSGQLYIDPIFFYSGAQVYDAMAPGGSLYPFASNGYVQSATGWTTTGYNFLFRSGDGSTASGGNGRNSWNESTMGFWSDLNGGSEYFPASSPAGGNFIALDAAYTSNYPWRSEPPYFSNHTRPLEQVVNGLTIGEEYQLTFYWAAAQQYGFDGDTTEFLTVTFGNETFTTQTIELPSHSFSGWMQETVTFTASAASQTLSFLAGGGPDGLPPFALLDGVSMKAVPEPGSLALLALGASAFLLVRSRRSKKE